MSKFSTLILRERLPDATGHPTGWLILGRASLYAEREILAILNYSIGLELAREYTALLAQKAGTSQILEETKQAMQESQAMEYGVVIQQPYE